MYFYPYYPMMMPMMTMQSGESMTSMQQMQPMPLQPVQPLPLQPVKPMPHNKKAPKVHYPEYDDLGEDEMDLALMHKMYPEVCKKIYKHVKDQCDNLETEDSCMYDEYPDYHTYQMLVDKIYKKMHKANEIPRTAGTFELLRNGQSNYLKELIGVVLLHEIFSTRRRRRRRRRRPHYYNYQPYGYDYYDSPYYY